MQLVKEIIPLLSLSVVGDKIHKLTLRQIRGLTEDHIRSITPEQIQSLNPKLFLLFSTIQIKAFTPDQIQAVTKEQFEFFTVDMIEALTPEQIESFTPEQKICFDEWKDENYILPIFVSSVKELSLAAATALETSPSPTAGPAL